MLMSSSNKIAFAIFVLVIASTMQVSAQQNLFNVPSGVVTPEGVVFFQQQFNLGRVAGTSNTSTAIGLGNGWEVGLNLLDVYM